VAFTVDYSGGWGAFKRPLWKTLRNACKPYHPRLRFLVTACTTPDGSHWALQNWRRLMPNGGYTNFRGEQGKWELHLSHWKGELPTFWLKQDWTKVRVGDHVRFVDHFFGQLTYRGEPVYGFSSTPNGNPTDSWGTLVWLDTYNSPWGSGWRRLNSFLTHNPYGNFCAFAGRLWGHKTFGMGSAYRAYVEGPGVTPVVYWQATALEYDHDLDSQRFHENRALIHDDATDGCYSY
jgi:hypothetical protein